MKMKKFVVAALAAAITVGSALPVSAAWVESGSDWKYQNEDGSWKANTWFQDGGKSYHFDSNGNVQKGWLKDTNGKWYFFAYNGAMQTGLIKVDSNVYFMNEDGSLFIGTKEINNVEYNFTEYGTTNGNPQVGASRTWAGNGNQTNVTKGGGGFSSPSGSGSGSSTSVTTKQKVEKTVESVVKEFDGEYLTASVSGKKITLSVQDEQGTVTAEEMVSEVSDILEQISEDENIAEIVWKGQIITDADSILTAAANLNLDLDKITLDSLKGKSYTVSVITSDGVTIQYTFIIE